MTDKPYTEADVEVVARALPLDPDGLAVTGMEAEPDGFPMPIWGPPANIARRVLDALVERGHGLAPVIAHQWSVRYPDGFVDGGRFTEAGARQRAAELGGEVVYRAVGPWIAAEARP